MHDPQTEQYGPPCSLCGGFNHSPKHCYKGEHDINNIMEKMSINPHQQQQNNIEHSYSHLVENLYAHKTKTLDAMTVKKKHGRPPKPKATNSN